MKPHIVVIFFGTGFVEMKQSLIKLKTHDADFSMLDLRPPISEIVEQIKELKPDGILLQSWLRYMAPIVELDIPKAIVNATVPQPHCINVGVDDTLASEMAADYFLDTRFKHFAYIGNNVPYSIRREASFKKTLKRAVNVETNYQALMLEPERSYLDQLENKHSEIADWLKALPKPTGLLAATDPLGQTVCSLAKKNGMLIPDDIAVLGMMDDILHCELSNPPLSSIPFNWNRMCDLGGELLLDWLKTGSCAELGTLKTVAPKQVHVRQSSNAHSVEDPTTRRALNWLREHAHQPVDVAQLCQALSLNRRTLEKSFKKYLNRTPREELERLRVERVKYYLSNTDMSMPFIADTCGFNDPARMTIAFKRVEGMPPANYRKRHSS